MKIQWENELKCFIREKFSRAVQFDGNFGAHFLKLLFTILNNSAILFGVFWYLFQVCGMKIKWENEF